MHRSSMQLMEVVSSKNRSDQRFGAAVMKTCEEVQKVTKVDRRSTSDEKKIQEKSPEFLK